MLRNGLEPWHLLIVAIVIILMFGSKKLPEAARGLGKSMRILKSEAKAMKDEGATGPSADAARDTAAEPRRRPFRPRPGPPGRPGRQRRTTRHTDATSREAEALVSRTGRREGAPHPGAVRPHARQPGRWWGDRLSDTTQAGDGAARVVERFLQSRSNPTGCM